MTDMQEIVGDDVTIAPDAPEEVQAEPEAQQETEQKEQAAPEPEQPRVVPLAALHEERQRRKELAAQLAEESRKRTELEARVEARLAALQPPAPTFEEDPAGHLKRQIDQVSTTLQERQQQEERQRAEYQQAQQVQRAAQTVQRYEAEFVAQKPDYQQAVDYVRLGRAKEFEARGMAPEEAMAEATREMVHGAIINAANGVNPSQLVYRMAEIRGYRAQAQPMSESDRFTQQSKGVAAAKSLGGGGASKGQISATQLLSMSDEEFSEATKGGKWNKLMG